MSLSRLRMLQRTNSGNLLPARTSQQRWTVSWLGIGQGMKVNEGLAGSG
ncbi:MAG: hypothetical protein V1792_17485 [Pseudomonadota bacterium]